MKDAIGYLVTGVCNGEKAVNIAVVTKEFEYDATPETFERAMRECVSGLIQEKHGPDAEFSVSWVRSEETPLSALMS